MPLLTELSGDFYKLWSMYMIQGPQYIILVFNCSLSPSLLNYFNCFYDIMLIEPESMLASSGLSVSQREPETTR